MPSCCWVAALTRGPCGAATSRSTGASSRARAARIFVEGRGEQELCIIAWQSHFVSAPDDCEACEFAFELEYGTPDVEVDLDCSAYDIDLESIAGTRIVIGYGGGDQLWVREGGTWAVGGYAEYSEADSEMGFELGLEEE